MHISVLQFDIRWESPSENLATVSMMLNTAPPPRFGLVVLPEMCATGFSMDPAATLPDAGVILKFLTHTAKLYNTSILAGVAMKDHDDAPRNMAVLVNTDGNIEFTYAKRNPFAPTGEEGVYYAGSAPGLFEFEGARCCVAICYDLRFDEIFTEAAAAGTDIFFVLANFPAARRDDWNRLLIERAKETHAYVVGVNRIGHDPNETYSGDSVILGPDGEPLATAGEQQTTITASFYV